MIFRVSALDKKVVVLFIVVFLFMGQLGFANEERADFSDVNNSQYEYFTNKPIYNKIDEYIENGVEIIDFIKPEEFSDIYGNYHIYGKYSEYVSSYYILKGKVVLTFYKPIDEIKNEIKSVDDYIERELNKLEEDLSDLDKVKKIHDLILAEIDYVNNLDQVSYSEGGSKSIDLHTAFAAVETGQTVCTGYSKLFMEFLDELGVPNITLTGRTNVSHMWNLVYLDGLWYHFDLTNNDYIRKPTGYDVDMDIPSAIINPDKKYKYFLMTDEEISLTHEYKIIPGFESVNENAESLREAYKAAEFNDAYKKVLKANDLKELGNKLSGMAFNEERVYFVLDSVVNSIEGINGFNKVIFSHMERNRIYSYKSIMSFSSKMSDGRYLIFVEYIK